MGPKSRQQQEHRFLQFELLGQLLTTQKGACQKEFCDIARMPAQPLNFEYRLYWYCCNVGKQGVFS